jgi:biopolymer transport protein ExbB
MDTLKTSVEWGVMGLLLALSIWAVAVAMERWRWYRRVQVLAYSSRARLEADLTQRLNIIGSVAANAPYIGLLGTVLGIMFTFEALGRTGSLDAKTIMIGLALALKATAAGIAVAIPCVVMNNALRRIVRVKLAEFDEARGA